MGPWRYAIVTSQAQQVQTPAGLLNIVQVLNSAGQHGGELVAVVTSGANVFQWVIKFPLQAPAQPFE